MTPLLPQLSKGFWKKNWLKRCPFFFVSKSFFTNLVPFFFFFDNWDPKKIHLRRLDMDFPFYPNSYNGSRLRLIRENLRKLNKQKNWFGRNHVLECSGRGRPPEWGSTGGPPVAWSIMPPSPRSGRSLPSSSSNKIKRDIEKKFVIKF